jgi:hypothetical protein
MARFARWYVLLGVVAAVPAALLLGLSAGELLRNPTEGMTGLRQREGIVLALGVMAIFLFRTAAGLRDGRAWALHLGMALAGLLALAGIAGLAAGGAIMDGIGLAPQLVLGTVPVSLGACLLGTRLLVGLWPHSALPQPQPFGWRDLRAIGTLAAVVGAATLSHVLVAGIAA